ncbi:hypothetical protein HDU98_000314 [Podochytrium sp. JEL0797]|nr:hypothetical protein HDU98_000314 [Podochytrium sp. JEL0797]
MAFLLLTALSLGASATPQHDMGMDMSGSGSGSNGPVCQMMYVYLHQDLCGLYLFENAQPKNNGEYVAGLLGTALLAFTTLWLESFTRKVVKARRVLVKSQEAVKLQGETCCSEPVVPKPKISRLAGFKDQSYLAHLGIKYPLVFVGILMRYALMLIVMTFNLGIILAACFGFTVGSILFQNTATELLLDCCA